MKKKAKLVLEDGSVFEGFSCGVPGESYGEVVFNTALSGYQEILSDPSYKGQIVTMTYPLIGNYGVVKDDDESRHPFLSGMVIRECSNLHSNYRANQSLPGYFKENRIVAIDGVDTRRLTKLTREKGSLRSIISTRDLNDISLLKKVKASQGTDGIDLVKEVTTSTVRHWNRLGKYKVVVIDCGVKYNILRCLAAKGCHVITVPASTSAEKILSMKPHGIMVSNGPGDPAAVTYVIETLKELFGKVPMFGICLGHQMISLALGGKTYKLKFGHHGGNHPVKDLKTGTISITSQNHSYCVDIKSLKKQNIELTHINLNDGTLEGMAHKKLPLFSIQFHPEAAPGPHDAAYLFDNFINMMKKKKNAKA